MFNKLHLLTRNTIRIRFFWRSIQIKRIYSFPINMIVEGFKYKNDVLSMFHVLENELIQVCIYICNRKERELQHWGNFAVLFL
jgi:hypothetical protein